tara:strand:+ start:6591 stop:6974 length:384 start_codon:yes stop_codon:yes gene_type:complete
MKLTSNFSKSEFECKCGCEMPKEVLLNIQKLANQLQILRNKVGVSIKINSAYRCLKHNKSIGGVSNSQHVLGKASDVVISGFKPSKTFDLISELINNGDMLQGGLGAYNSFTHYDIRGKKARWNFTK